MANRNPKDDILNCFIEQLSELELLCAMYPDPGEIVFSDNKVLDDIKSFVGGQSDYIPGHLDFTLNITINSIKLELCIDLPTFYPNVEPDIYVRSNQLNRSEQTNLNTALSEFAKAVPLGEPSLYSLITWIQDNISDYIGTTNNNEQCINHPKEVKKEYFARYWIYSHHIYNKKKREEILNTAKILNLSGFCLPGKPGIICIEGNESSCKEWWQVIKAMNWKKIIIKKTEIFEVEKMLENKKFDTFTEIHFQKSCQPGSKHMDMKGFSKYMNKCGLIDVFNEIFGLDCIV